MHFKIVISIFESLSFFSKRKIQVIKLKETKGDHFEHASMTRKGNITQVEETQRGVL